MDGIKIPVEAKLDGDDAAVQQFVKQFNTLGESVAKLNKLKFSPIDKASLDQIKALNAQWDKLLKHPAFSGVKARLKATDQTNAGFLGVDWSKTHPNEVARRGAMMQAFQFVTGGNLLSQPPAPPAPPPTAPPAPAPGSPAPPPGPRAAPAPAEPPSQLRRIGSAAANAAGPAGQIATTAIGEGLQFGAFAGIMGLLGGVAALGIGKLIGGVRDKVGSAQNELVGYDTLKRTLGDVNVSFSELKESLRDSARTLDMTFDDALRHGTTFTRLAGLTGDDGAKSLQDEVTNAGGFSRSFGLDPSQGVSFFAQQRLMGITKNADESRKLGLLIGEGIAKAGVFSKVDEVLDALTSFATMQTRQGMVGANVGGYMSFLTAGMGSGIPGTDPASMASLLARVNASIAAGGGAGEAGQNFMFSALGSRLGLNPIQTGILREQGAFGTGAKTFGDGSLYSQYMKAFGGDQASDTARLSTKTNMQMLLEQFEKIYAGRPDLMANAMSNVFGTTMSQSMALSTINKKHGGQTLGALGDRLGRLGINLSDVNMTGLSRIAQIEASPNLSEDDKNSRIKEAALQNQEQTEGSRTRATISGVERAVQKMASELVSPLNDIRAAVMYLAGEGGKKGPLEIMRAVARAESGERADAIRSGFDPQIDAARKDIDLFSEMKKGKLAAISGRASDAEADKRRMAEAADLERQELEARRRLADLTKQKADALEAEQRRLDGDMRRIKDGSGMQLGSAPSVAAAANLEGLNDDQTRLMLAINGQESSGNDKVGDSNRGAVGGMQMLPSTFAQFSDPGWDIRNPEHNKRAAARYIKFLSGKSGGNMRTTAGAYYGGEGAIGPNGTLRLRTDPKNPKAPNTLEYADQVMSRVRAGAGTPLPDVMSPEEAAAARAPLSSPMPDEARDGKDRTPSGGAASVNVSGVFQLLDAHGNRRAEPVQVASTVRLPTPAGAA